MAVDETNRDPSNQDNTAGALPPEVAAELQRRAQGVSAEPVTAPWLQHAPPVEQPSAPPAGEAAPPPHPGAQDWLKRLGPIGIFLAYLLGKAKYLALVLKFGLPALKTGGSMLISMVVYAQVFGWRFAVGFVLSILAHEMGHVYVAWRMGVPVTAPLFIPGFGALIVQKREARSAWDEALIGIGGPIAGTLAGLVCWAAYLLTRSPLMLALAYTGFLINLFNLAPIFPLDGGWITGAISPRIWLIGIVGMIVLFASGTVHNPFIILLVIMSIPRLWRGLKTGDVTPKGGVPTSPQQRLVMGLAYVTLCGLLVWLMAHTHRAPADI
jgi:Zn-dependent protease